MKLADFECPFVVAVLIVRLVTWTVFVDKNFETGIVFLA